MTSLIPLRSPAPSAPGLSASDRAAALERLLAASGWDKAGRRLLAGDASFRRYDRLTRDSGATAVLMDAPPPLEDVRPFLGIARHLTNLGFSAPEVLAADETAGFVLLEDLGEGTYTRLLGQGHDETALYALAIDVLAELHTKTRARGLPADLPAYDDARMLAEPLLFAQWTVPALLGQALDGATLEAFRCHLAEVLPVARGVDQTLVLRDFHVDNLLLLPGRTGQARCGLLDFQDAVAGPLTYDLMSLLEDARRDIDPTLMTAMTGRYLDHFPGLDREAFAASWAVLAALRHLKVIGIFTRLAHRDGKPGYLVHIPRLWRLLERSLAHPALAPLARWLDHAVPKDARRVPDPHPLSRPLA
ncbi:aminoglycoside phosphotransferase [Rhodospirillum rubrum F11]|uniref:Aminoglycoside phosphotransferase n=3 Tax=Rhodospirillum rubrum TaxID=1085 RepID=Q2RNR4_RHORT|nr:phosphotransferase [Rhodospirillum rubrum]ABC24231.1 Aminoglycoside phosphotransferase [Rhodospirillum rubrum ATCC 11170]AEO49982.1 aminoglycoside phosphotransferase [Rhodospirillum rubrum F11]QXG80166.1 phosphotransferase [Rhodospirillum rubrum]